MKVMIVMALIVIVIIAAGVASESMISREATSMTNRLAEMENFIKQGNWQAADEALSSVEQQWQKANWGWTFTVDHDELDEIYSRLVRLRQFMHFHDPELSLAELRSASELIDHIPKKEKLSLESLL